MNKIYKGPFKYLIRGLLKGMRRGGWRFSTNMSLDIFWPFLNEISEALENEIFHATHEGGGGSGKYCQMSHGE